ncbi:hypothetical protein JQX13_38290 [Archangium violaceum]|uniref:hypothetical protein n=1 Tax=Archangium violaceum TaxID=83451 RepID=UPI00193C723F|nr:hypothetical protein [Archangium violaceum]QRK05942.1 hypothetical protein JQX13_38290 [Archangium violaceum]
MWPGNVPSQAQALEVLRGQRMLAVSLPGARKLQDKLTMPEREALQDDGLADCLRDAVAVRWRLAAAQDLLLSAGGKVDEVALNALLAEVDGVLEALRAANPASPDLALAIDRTWETLTQEAVDFSSNVKAASNQEAPPAPVHAAPKKHAATGKVTFQPDVPEERKAQGSRKALFAALALVVLAVGAYHGANVSRNNQRQQQSSYPGAPPSTLIIPHQTNGSLMMQSTRTGELTPEQQAWLEQQKAKGMQVKSLGQGSYLLTPASNTPVTAGNTAP